jgi:hypothetical protein
MLHSASRLWTLCCLLAAVAIAAGADGQGTDQRVPTGGKSVQVDTVPKTIRLQFLLDNAHAAKVISALEPQFKNVKFTLHPTMNGFYASGSRRDLLDIKGLVPSLDKAPEAPVKPERDVIEISYGDLAEIKGLIASLVPNVRYTIDEEQHLLTLEGPRASIELLRETFSDDWDEPTQVLIDCQLVDLSQKGWQKLCQPFWCGPQAIVHRYHAATRKQSLIPDVGLGKENTVAASLASQDLGPEIRFFIGSESTIQPTLQSLQGINEATIFAHHKIGLIAGKPALFHFGDKFPIIYFDPRAGQFQVQYVDLGFRLDIKATLVPNDKLECELTAETQSLLSLVNHQYPQTAVRRFNIPMRVREGETIVIGGLMSEEERQAGSKVPLLYDLPIFGGLFRSSGERNGREVVVMLTPRVMR